MTSRPCLAGRGQKSGSSRSHASDECSISFDSLSHRFPPCDDAEKTSRAMGDSRYLHETEKMLCTDTTYPQVSPTSTAMRKVSSWLDFDERDGYWAVRDRSHRARPLFPAADEGLAHFNVRSICSSRQVSECSHAPTHFVALLLLASCYTTLEPHSAEELSLRQQRTQLHVKRRAQKRILAMQERAYDRCCWTDGPAFPAHGDRQRTSATSRLSTSSSEKGGCTRFRGCGLFHPTPTRSKHGYSQSVAMRRRIKPRSLRSGHRSELFGHRRSHTPDRASNSSTVKPKSASTTTCSLQRMPCNRSSAIQVTQAGSSTTSPTLTRRSNLTPAPTPLNELPFNPLDCVVVATPQPETANHYFQKYVSDAASTSETYSAPSRALSPSKLEGSTSNETVVKRKQNRTQADYFGSEGVMDAYVGPERDGSVSPFTLIPQPPDCASSQPGPQRPGVEPVRRPRRSDHEHDPLDLASCRSRVRGYSRIQGSEESVTKFDKRRCAVYPCDDGGRVWWGRWDELRSLEEFSW